MFILETERARANSTKFLIPGDRQILLVSFRQNRFPTTFGGHLEFLSKTQKRVYLGNGERARAILMIFLTHSEAAVSFSCNFWRPS